MADHMTNSHYTTDEGAPLINKDTCILDKNTSKTGQSSNSDYTPDCDTTFSKQVIDNKTKEGNTCSKQYVESIEIDTFAKQVIDNKTKEGNTCNKQYVKSTEIDTFAKQVIDNKTKEGNPCNKQYVESTENETNNDMAVTQYNPEKLFEKMENNFVQALEKVCKQQADMFASKMEVMENFYRNSVKDTNDKLCKILETITTSLNTSNTEHVKFFSQIHSLENENHTLKDICTRSSI